MFRRSLVFSDNETRLMRAYASALHDFSRVPRGFATTASEDVLTRAIAAMCSASDDQARVLESAMQAVVRHASKTYEGVRVAVNLCLDLADAATGEPLSAFLEQPWAPVLGSGLTTAIQLSGDGSVLRVIDLPAAPNEEVLAPDSFTTLATWTSDEERIGLSVTRSGEVYLYANGELLFARRNSRWQGFPLPLIRDSGWFGATKQQLPRRVKRAALTSLLDATAAHHGACLGIVTRAKRDDAVRNLLDPSDRWSAEGNPRRALLGESQFQFLSRRRRLELLSMDGATLIEQSGRILAAGAILRVPGGSPGGGRTAAAHAISDYGVGIKVSQDGPIKAFVKEGGELIEHFSMG